MAKAEGKVFEFLSKDKITTDFLESMPYDGNPQMIEYHTNEFSAVCPYSGLPDIAKVFIKYVPNKKIIELKSLKYYFVSFRNVGITQEEVTDKIFSDLKDIFVPRYLSVVTVYNTRGGIDSTCTMEYGDIAAKMVK